MLNEIQGFLYLGHSNWTICSLVEVILFPNFSNFLIFILRSPIPYYPRDHLQTIKFRFTTVRNLSYRFLQPFFIDHAFGPETEKIPARTRSFLRQPPSRSVRRRFPILRIAVAVAQFKLK